MAIGLVAIGEQFADVAKGRSSEDSIRDCVQQHIRVAVAHRVSIMRDLDATDPERSTLSKAVRIVANANPLVRRLSSLSW